MRKRKRGKLIVATTAVLIAAVMFTFSASAVQYSYDALNRLVKSERENGDKTQYEYDAAGNLLRVTTSSTTSSLANGIENTSVTTIAGWIPFATVNVDAQFSVVESVYSLHENNQQLEVDLTMLEQEVVEGEQDTDTVTDAQPGFNEASSLLVQRITASGQGGANVYQDIAVNEQLYEIRGEIQASQLDNAAAQVIVNYYNEQNQLIGYENVINVLETSDWISFEKELTIPTGAVKARTHLQLLLLETTSSGDVSYSGIEFETVSVPSGDEQ